MRLFLGATISPATNALITEWRNKHLDLPVRWIADKNLHITLVPPWNAENPDSAIAILKSLSNLLRSAVFELSAIHTELKANQPAMIWLSGNVTPSLLSLKKSLGNGFGKKDVSQTFHPHITLAKFRKSLSEPTKPIFEPLTGVEMISRIQLFHSRLNESGADYEIIHDLKFVS